MNTPKGLTVISDFITPYVEKQLLDKINNKKWNTKLSRRTQHYGYEYNYKKRNTCNETTKIPKWCHSLNNKMIKEGITETKFNQVIINEYKKGQGISKHIDASIFGETIVSLSLGTERDMIFTRYDETCVISLKPRTLVVLTGDARYKWKHEIARASASDVPRVSITFRTYARTTVTNIRKQELNKRGINDFEEWSAKPNALYIGRNMSFYVKGAIQSKWHNPYSVKKYGLDKSLALFKKHIENNEELLEQIHELDNKELGCWCKPNKCHGDVLIDLLKKNINS